MRWLGVLAAIVAAIGIAAIDFHALSKSYTHRYKLTAGLAVDSSERVESSVIEVMSIQQSQNLPVPALLDLPTSAAKLL